MENYLGEIFRTRDAWVTGPGGCDLIGLRWISFTCVFQDFRVILICSQSRENSTLNVVIRRVHVRETAREGRQPNTAAPVGV